MAGTKQLQDLGLDAHVVQQLTRAGMKCARDVLLHSKLDLVELMGLSFPQAQDLIKHVSSAVAPSFITASQLFTSAKATQPLWSGLPGLDDALRRGIPFGSITEIVGPSGVGKSQTCFMMSLRAALPSRLNGLEGSVLYIDTERKFSGQRIKEMARHSYTEDMLPAEELDRVMNRILLMSPQSPQELMTILQSLEALILQHSLRLVVLDSVAAVVRLDFVGRTQVIERQELLGQHASRLKYLAETYSIPVLVTNQVTARMHPARSHSISGGAHGPGIAPAAGALGTSGSGSGSGLSAALGTKWAHCVNVRLVVERVGQHRYLKVVKSPASPNLVLEYVVTARGVEQVVDAQIPPSVQQSVLDISIANELEMEGASGYEDA